MKSKIFGNTVFTRKKFFFCDVKYLMTASLKWAPLFSLKNDVHLTFKGTVMQIEKPLIKDRLGISKVFWKFRIPTIYNFAVIYPWNLLIQFLLSFLFINKTLWLNNIKTRTVVNGKISVFVIRIEPIIYLLSYNLHVCIFKGCSHLRITIA